MVRAMSATLLCLLALPALAADNGFYLGGSVGQANVQDQDELSGFELDSDDNGFKLIAGFRPLDFLGFELNYVDLGKPQDTIGGVDVEIDANGIDAFAVGFLPLPFMDLFLKAGLISWDAEASVEGFGSVSDSGEDFAWGAGAQLRFGSVAVRAEYEQFEISDVDDVNLISLGLTWTFL